MSETTARTTRRMPSMWVVLIAALGVLALLWVAPTIAGAVAAIDLSGLNRPYLVIAGFVVLDAVIPIFPSESLLTTASNLAAQDDSNILLWKLILAGTLGAILGDSLLYWLARTVLRPSMTRRVEQAHQNDKVARSLEVMSQTAPALIVFGRFVPGLRFVIGATMGITRYPFRRFLLWDAIGGFFWAAYTCIFCYLIATVIADKPVVSIATSVVVTTALLGLLYRPLKRHWDASASGHPSGTDDRPEPGTGIEAGIETGATG